MKAKNLKPIIISALLAVGFGATTVGTSFALFTDSAETNINVTAGKVDVSGELKGLTLYSAEANAEGTVLDENNAKYSLVEQTGTFKNGGTAVINAAKDTLTLTNITPGDKVAFTFDLGNESNVNIKYRFGYEVVNEGELNSLAYLDLVKGLETTIGTEKFSGLKTYKSAWADVAANATLSDVDFSIYLPMNKDNRYQSKRAKIRVFVEAVQGNAVTTDGKVVETIEEDLINTATVVAGDPTVLIAKNPEESVTVKTTIPADTTGVAAGVDVKLEVSDLVESDETSDTTIKNLDFDLSLYVNGTKVEEFQTYIPVEINIGPGYDIASIKHKTEEILPYDATNNPHGYTYDINEGIIRFETKDFSPFTVSYRTKVIEVQTYADLKLAAAQPYAYVRMLNDIQVPLRTVKSGMAGARAVYEPDTILVAKNVTIDGTGHSLILPSFYVDDETLIAILTDNGVAIKLDGDNVTLKGLTIDRSHLLNQDGIVNVNFKDNLSVIDCAFYADKDYITNGNVFINVTKNIFISGVRAYDSFAFIYESGGNVLEGIVTIEDSVIDTAAYTFNFGTCTEGKAYVNVSNSTLKGWTSYSGLVVVAFENVKFQTSSSPYGSSYMNYLRNYNSTTFKNCVFDIKKSEGAYGFYIDPYTTVVNDADATVFENCKVRFVDENNRIETLSAGNIPNFKEDHDFSCTVDGVKLRVTATSATVIE